MLALLIPLPRLRHKTIILLSLASSSKATSVNPTNAHSFSWWRSSAGPSPRQRHALGWEALLNAPSCDQTRRLLPSGYNRLKSHHRPVITTLLFGLDFHLFFCIRIDTKDTHFGLFKGIVDIYSSSNIPNVYDFL